MIQANNIVEIIINEPDAQALTEGREAFLLGKDSNKNPYFLRDSWKSLSWHQGWFEEFELSKHVNHVVAIKR